MKIYTYTVLLTTECDPSFEFVGRYSTKYTGYEAVMDVTIAAIKNASVNTGVCQGCLDVHTVHLDGTSEMAVEAPSVNYFEISRKGCF